MNSFSITIPRFMKFSTSQFRKIQLIPASYPAPNKKPFNLTMSTTDDYDSDRKPGESFSTVSLHHGQTLDSDHRARAPPIYASTSFAFEDAAHGADVSQRRAMLFLTVSIQVPVAAQQRSFLCSLLSGCLS